MLKVKRQKKQQSEPPSQVVMGEADIIPGIPRKITPDVICRSSPVQVHLASIFSGVTASTDLTKHSSPVPSVEEETCTDTLPISAALITPSVSPVVVNEVMPPKHANVEPPNPENAHYDPLGTWGNVKRAAPPPSIWKRVFG